MCTYNGARHIREQLESIGKQSRLPDELVVCDDCSDAADDTREIVADFARTAPFPVRLHVNSENIGSTQNFGRAIALCTGDIIALADQDDVWQTHKLETLIKGFSSSPETGVVFADAYVVDERLRQSGYTFMQCINFSESERLLLDGDKSFELLVRRGLVAGATMAFRSKYTNLILPMPPNLGVMLHDSWIAIIISAVAKIKYIDEPLQLYRQHPGQQVGVKVPTEGEIPNRWRRLMTDYLGDIIGDIERLKIVQGRLSGTGNIYDSEQAKDYVAQRSAHLRVRFSARQLARAGRIRLVMRELLALRYHQHSNGVFSFGKDLLCQRAVQPHKPLRTPPEPIA